MSKSRIEQLKEMLKKDPDNALGRYGLANEYYKSGNFSNSISELEKYFQIKEDEGAAYRLLAESYLNTGNKEKAIQAYKKGIEASKKYGHPSMAEEFEEAIEFIQETRSD